MKDYSVVFGIDVSKAKLSVSVLIKKKEIDHFDIANDAVGFKPLLEQLQEFAQPVVIFEATGVYSLSLEAFLNYKGYDYVKINPLKAKKLMDNNLRHNKTDRVDAHRLAMIEFVAPQALSTQQPKEYRELQAASRYYEELTQDTVKAKNRLHRALQTVFPQIEQLMGTPSGKQYWQLVELYSHPRFVLEDGFEQISSKLQDIAGIGRRKSCNLANSLQNLAKLAYAYCDYDSVQVKLVRRLAQQLIDLEAEKAEIIDYMEEIAPKDDLELYLSVPGIARITALRLIAELGDLRRFKSTNQIDAFVGIDPGRYQSGEYDGHLGISKHGNHIARKILYLAIGQIASASSFNPCHIADYYKAKKQSFHSTGYKKIAIASVHKLIRTLYALIINGQAYDYNVAKLNQRL